MIILRFSVVFQYFLGGNGLLMASKIATNFPEADVSFNECIILKMLLWFICICPEAFL